MFVGDPGFAAVCPTAAVIAGADGFAGLRLDELIGEEAKQSDDAQQEQVRGGHAGHAGHAGYLGHAGFTVP